MILAHVMFLLVQIPSALQAGLAVNPKPERAVFIFCSIPLYIPLLCHKIMGSISFPVASGSWGMNLLPKQPLCNH